MALPAPNLDDRRFQDLVDEAKIRVQQHCPGWSDHNVSDPGVTLIETFAWMTEQLIYRLNRVPDRTYVKFLELIGVRLFPPVAARTDVTFWLSAPQPENVRVPAGTQVATVRTETEPAITFSTTRDRAIVAATLGRAATQAADGTVRDQTRSLTDGKAVACFSEVPAPGDALLIGLTAAVPACAVVLRFDCTIEGIGVDPENPPLAWQAWDGANWADCEVGSDTTKGFNQPGDVFVHVPPTHTEHVIGRQRAGWLRAVVTEPSEEQPPYQSSPTVRRLTAFTKGATVEAVHAEMLLNEVVGTAAGVPGERFVLARRPVVAASEPIVLDVAGSDGVEEWSQVEDFTESNSDDRHFTVDAAAGELIFGPAVRDADGQLRHHGAVPPKGAVIQVRSYRSGGGQAGNVAARTLRVLRSSVPFVTSAENRHAAAGGRDGEDIENAKVRGPLVMRSRNRAVTAEDYEEITYQAARELARVKAIEATIEGETGGVRVLVVPHAMEEGTRLRFQQLIPQQATIDKIVRALDERRAVGARVLVRPAHYQGITAVGVLKARPSVAPERLEGDALAALYGYFHPLRGGPDGRGWPFGRPVLVGEVFGVLQRVPGCELVEEASLYKADPTTRKRSKALDRIELPEDMLVFSFEHQVQVKPA